MKADTLRQQTIKLNKEKQEIVNKIKSLQYLDIPKYEIKEVVLRKYASLTLEAFEELFTEAYTTLHK
jgi:hypothetical protein